ncbi:hypothetical protein NXC24_PA00218 (plasmid) [Rhizobium sp. NXC24]|nr:hypothetical protein NXC24_PA00218 [Rhizobium sp. NXC24]
MHAQNGLLVRKMDVLVSSYKRYAVGDAGTVIIHRALRRSQVFEFFSKLDTRPRPSTPRVLPNDLG